jgi:hypothetical protein
MKKAVVFFIVLAYADTAVFPRSIDVPVGYNNPHITEGYYSYLITKDPNNDSLYWRRGLTRINLNLLKLGDYRGAGLDYLEP